MSFLSLLACRVYAEKSTDSLIGGSFVGYFFPLVAFKIFFKLNDAFTSLFAPFFLIALFFFLFFLFSFNWGIVVLQCCVSFYCTVKWNSLCYTAGSY